MKNKPLAYFGTLIIGIGFIMMAMSNVLKSELASTLQALLGGLFIVLSIIRITQIRKSF